MNTKKTLVLVSALFIALGMSVYAKGGSQAAAGLTTLQVFSLPSNTSGLQTNSYWSDILKEDLGIAVELLPSGNQGNQQLQTMMASRALPDIVIFFTSAEVENAVKAGLLVNLDEHKDKLPNVYANAPNAIQFYRDTASAGTGGLYSVPNNVTSRSQNFGGAAFGPYLRWDYYKELGYPVINEIEDYLPLLKKMQDAHPVNEDGQKVYGISLWPDWDNVIMVLPYYMTAVLYGQMQVPGGAGFLEIDLKTGASRSILDDTSYYKRGLKFFFTANQMGLLDPDSLTQRWDDYLNKASAGRVLFTYASYAYGNFNTSERGAQGVGFKLVSFKNEKILSSGAPSYVGGGWSWSIGKATKNLDKALALLDYMYSYDGVWKMANGPKGQKWDIDEKGEPYITRWGWDLTTGKVQEYPNGGRDWDGLSVINSYGIHTRNIHPVYKRQIDTADWIKKDFAPPDDRLTVEWKTRMNAQDDLDYLTKNNMTAEPPFAPMNPEPDNIVQIRNRAGDVVRPMSWQMVFAKDEAEFNRLWKEMVERAKGVGLDTVNQWYLNDYNQARASGSKYMK